MPDLKDINEKARELLRNIYDLKLHEASTLYSILVRVFTRLGGKGFPVRCSILLSLYVYGPCSYTRLANIAGIDLETGAGDYAYHLRRLKEAGLIIQEEEENGITYRLSRMGEKLVEFFRIFLPDEAKEDNAIINPKIKLEKLLKEALELLAHL